MTAETAANPYLRTRVMTASPAELRLLLFDGAVKFAQQGHDGLATQDYEAMYNGVSRCQAILIELMTALRAEHDEELCSRLNALYTYMYTRLMESMTDRSLDAIAEVVNLLNYERETWAMLLDQLAAENAAAGTLDATPAVPIPSNESNIDSLIGNSVSLQG